MRLISSWCFSAMLSMWRSVSGAFGSKCFDLLCVWMKSWVPKLTMCSRQLQKRMVTIPCTDLWDCWDLLHMALFYIVLLVSTSIVDKLSKLDHHGAIIQGTVRCYISSLENISIRQHETTQNNYHLPYAQSQLDWPPCTMPAPDKHHDANYWGERSLGGHFEVSISQLHSPQPSDRWQQNICPHWMLAMHCKWGWLSPWLHRSIFREP